MKSTLWCALLLCLLLVSPARAQTLAPGDIAIVGMNADNPDAFAFVALVDISAGTSINFTDNGWQATGGFRSNEQVVVYTAPSTISAGTVVSFNSDNTNVPQFSASGDQVLAYQGSDATPTFLHALNNEGAGVWQPDATSSNTSAVPAGLADGSSAVAVNEQDNVRYNGPTTGSKAQLFADINNRTNWTGSDDTRQSFPASFTVTGSGGGNAPPQFTQALTAQAVDVGTTLGFTYEATDPDGDALTFSLESPPTGATLDPASGVFSWTPGASQGGMTFTVTATVSDGMATAQTSAQITVNPLVTNVPPIFTEALPDSLYSEGEVVRYTYAAQDNDMDAVTLTLEEAPPGATFDPATGVLTWTAGAAGVYAVTVSASDGTDAGRTTAALGVQGTLFGGQSGAALRASLRSAFAPDQTLGYDVARDTMYAIIDLDADGFVRGIYTGFARELTPGDPSIVMFNNGSSNGINAEHSWPQSKGAGDEPARSDLHSLFPAKSNVNSARSNKPYAEIPDTQTTAWYRLDQAQSNTPTSDIDAWSESIDGFFEPREAVKGNVARAALYFYSVYEGVAEVAFLQEQVGTLVDWNGLDRPDGAEAGRTERIARYQGNVNPFIVDTTLAARAFSDFTMPVSVEDAAELPGGIALSAAYPNPFNPQTTLDLEVGRFQEVTVALYDVMGRRVQVVWEGALHPGHYPLTVEAGGLPSGLYHVRALGESALLTQSIVLLK